MTMYWMLDSPWPSFFGHIIDYYLKPGGAYFGAKKGLRPVNMVYNYRSGGDNSAKIFVTNQTLASLSDLQASVALTDLDGRVKFSARAGRINVRPNSSVAVLEIPRDKEISPVFFVHCQLRTRDGQLVTDNVYWDSTKNDELGPPDKENAFDSSHPAWADLSAVNNMKAAKISATGKMTVTSGWSSVMVTLKNESPVPAFFVRAEIVNTVEGDEILPVTWSDNYVTIFGGESMTLEARYRVADSGGLSPMVRVQGHNVSLTTEPVGNSLPATTSHR